MKRTAALVLLPTLFLPATVLADPLQLASRVDAVTVYPAGVTVHRVGHAHLAAGEHQVVFGGLPMELVDDTLRIGGFGPGVTAESVAVRTGRMAEFTGAAIDRLAAECAGLERERAQHEQLRASLVRQFDALPRQSSPTERARLQAALSDAARRSADVAQRVTERTAALARARAEGERPAKFVTVDLAAAHEGELDLTLEYMLHANASWRPSYAARLDARGARVGLDVFATVQQSTGEDWSEVRLSVSSVVPSAGLALPTFEEQTITLEEADPAPTRTELLTLAGPSRPAAMAARGASPTDAAPTPTVPPPVPSTPIEQTQGSARPNLLAARLELPHPVTLRSGTTPRRLLATHADFAATLEHQAAPRQSASVYLAARFRNANPHPLLAGPVALFIGQDYVGSTNLRPVPTDEEVLLPFGVDTGVTVDRTLAARQLAQVAGRDQTTLRYQYRLTNHRDRPVTVTVFEQLPVSRSQSLTVRTLPGERAPMAHQDGDAPGVLRWQLRVAPAGTERWNLGYVVSAPRRRAVEGEIE